MSLSHSAWENNANDLLNTKGIMSLFRNKGAGAGEVNPVHFHGIPVHNADRFCYRCEACEEVMLMNYGYLHPF